MGAASRAGRWIFDVAVLVAVASAVWLGVTGNWDGAVRFAVVTAFMLASRGADVPAPFAGAFAVFVLLATWASVQHWYRQLWQFDVLVHFLTLGSLAAVAYFVLVRARLLPPARGASPALRSWAPTVWVVAVGVSAAVVWEFYEWVVEQINPSGMIVGYTDTVVDLFAGTLGSLVAGALVLRWARRQRRAAPRSAA
jgi:hypothetical protein